MTERTPTRRDALRSLRDLAVLWVGAGSVRARAGRGEPRVLLIVRSPSPTRLYENVATILRRRLETLDGLVLRELALASPPEAPQVTPPCDFAIAIGPEAVVHLDRTLPEGVPWTFLATFHEPTLRRPERVQGCLLEVDPESKLQVVRDVFPRVHQVGMLFDPAVNRALVERYERACKKLGLRLVARSVRDDDDLIRGLYDITKQCHALFLLNDTASRDERNFQRIRRDIRSRGSHNDLFLIGDSLRYTSEQLAVFAVEADLRKHLVAALQLAEEMVAGRVERWQVHYTPIESARLVLRADLVRDLHLVIAEKLPSNVEVTDR